MLYKVENSFNKNSNQIIIVNNIKQTKTATLTLYDDFEKIFETDAFIGKNGTTTNKIEGDGKTPIGIYKLGLIFGTHYKKELKLNENIEYVKINPQLYWVDDINSKYYNKLVDITKVRKDWVTAEHLIEYPKQYEYAIEIKINHDNIPGKRQCYFFTLQCK